MTDDELLDYWQEVARDCGAHAMRLREQAENARGTQLARILTLLAYDLTGVKTRLTMLRSVVAAENEAEAAYYADAHVA